MSKRVLVVLALLVLSILVVLLAVRILAKRESTAPQPSLGAPRSTEEVKAEEVFEDEAGFSFGHPTSLEVRDVTPEDGLYYTLLELAAGAQQMLVSAKDTKYKSLDEWMEKGEDAPQEATLIGAVSLDGVQARQYSLQGKLLTLAVDKNVLYRIESSDEEYWEKVHELFVSTFAFAAPEPSTGSSGGGNVIYEPETVIE